MTTITTVTRNPARSRPPARRLAPTHERTHAHAHANARARARAQARTHAQTHARKRAHARIRTQTRTEPRPRRSARSCPSPWRRTGHRKDAFSRRNRNRAPKRRVLEAQSKHLPPVRADFSLVPARQRSFHNIIYLMINFCRFQA